MQHPRSYTILPHPELRPSLMSYRRLLCSIKASWLLHEEERVQYHDEYVPFSFLFSETTPVFLRFIIYQGRFSSKRSES